MLGAGHVRWPHGGADMERAVRTPDGRTLTVEGGISGFLKTISAVSASDPWAISYN